MKKLLIAAVFALVPAVALADGVFTGTEGTYGATCCITAAAGQSELSAAGSGNAVAGAFSHGVAVGMNIGEAKSVATFNQTLGGFSAGHAAFGALGGLQALAIGN